MKKKDKMSPGEKVFWFIGLNILALFIAFNWNNGVSDSEKISEVQQLQGQIKNCAEDYETIKFTSTTTQEISTRKTTPEEFVDCIKNNL